MRLDLAERLRCPRAHAPTPLIVVAQEVSERELVRGFAGCPECHLEAKISEGDVIFPGIAHDDLAHRVSEPRPTTEAVERVRAQLGLAEPGGGVLLTGRYVAFAKALEELLDVAAVTMHAPRAAVQLSEPVVPFSDHSFRAVALDAGVIPALALDAVRTVQAGGRVLGALPASLPLGVRELARDEREWVGQRDSEVVKIRRR